MAILLKSDGNSTTVTINAADRLGDLQALVGGYFETFELGLIKPPDASEPSMRWMVVNEEWMIVDEEGKSEQLPVNSIASALACREIVGDVVICDAYEIGSPDN